MPKAPQKSHLSKIHYETNAIEIKVATRLARHTNMYTGAFQCDERVKFAKTIHFGNVSFILFSSPQRFCLLSFFLLFIIL